MQRTILTKFSHSPKHCFRLHKTLLFSSQISLTSPPPEEVGDRADDILYTDVPRLRQDKSERKPYPTPMKVLIRRAKEEKEARKAQPCRMLENPPDNGLLVPELVDVAYSVHRAWESILSGLNKLVRVVPVRRCRFCHEVHIGKAGHEIRTCTGPSSGTRNGTHVWRKGRIQDVVFFPKCYHLYDRVGKSRVIHDEQSSVPRLPAILELCIQAGVELEKYPAKRRTKPVYSIEGRIVDFEIVNGNNSDPLLGSNEVGRISDVTKIPIESEENSKELSVKVLDAWVEMILGAKKIMEKYKVWTCGYCTEVQVGPKGHKVRMCKASKHQSRDGLHAWQEATLDDIIGPNYVWHVRDLSSPVLDNNLKRYYGKAPALVELCVQAGAPVPYMYRSMMRLDVVPPDRDEVDLVA